MKKGFYDKIRVILFENVYIVNWSVVLCDKQYIFLVLKYSSSMFIFDVPINGGNRYSNLRCQLFYELDTFTDLAL